MKIQVLFLVVSIFLVYTSKAATIAESKHKDIVETPTDDETEYFSSPTVLPELPKTKDKLIFRKEFTKAPITNMIQSQNFVFRGANKITSIQAWELGKTQYASAGILSGGIDQNSVAIQFSTSRGCGYHIRLEIRGI